MSGVRNKIEPRFRAHGRTYNIRGLSQKKVLEYLSIDFGLFRFYRVCPVEFVSETAEKKTEAAAAAISAPWHGRGDCENPE